MDQLFINLCKEDGGQGMVEYALILALVALVAMTGFGLLGSQIKVRIDQFSTSY